MSVSADVRSMNVTDVVVEATADVVYEHSVTFVAIAPSVIHTIFSDVESVPVERRVFVAAVTDALVRAADIEISIELHRMTAINVMTDLECVSIWWSVLPHSSTASLSTPETSLNER